GRTLWRIPGAKGTPLAKDKQYRLTAAQQSMPAVFNRAGYDTFRTCKAGNVYPEANRLFTVSKIAKKNVRPKTDNSDWHAEQVLEYLEHREASNDHDPFLLYFGFTHPHDPRNGKPELLEKYGAINQGDLNTPNPKAPALPVNYLPAHPFHHGHPGLRDEEKVQGVKTRRDEATVRNEMGREYACIENIDRQVGRVLDQLEAMGELDNTYIFFTADHGIAVGRHGLMGKQNLYEHTWRVPFIVRGPGIEPGSKTSAMVYLLDLLPTFCELTGTPIPETVEGESFADLLRGQTDRGRDHVYGAYCGGTKPGMRSIKTGHWKLIKYNVLDGAVQETQLFDLETNPDEYLHQHFNPDLQSQLGISPSREQVNLAEDPAYAERRAELEQLLRDQQRALGDPYEM
ncbi:MAG: sulfatase-like hydrolase/transferase, partial [Bythopirellula sp.]